jgi:hypothetical protein
MAGRSQMIAAPGYPDLERSQTDARSTRIRRAFELSQRGLITGCGFHLSPIQGYQRWYRFVYCRLPQRGVASKELR